MSRLGRTSNFAFRGNDVANLMICPINEKFVKAAPETKSNNTTLSPQHH